jgi:phage tail-like protein
MARQTDPYRSFKFRLDVASISTAVFSEMTISDVTYDVIEYRWSDMEATTYKINGLKKNSNVVLTSGVTDSMDLFNWFNAVYTEGVSSQRQTVTVALLDETGTPGGTAGPTWTLANAWPSKLTAPILNAKGNDYAIEKLELSHEGLERTKP